MPTFQNIGDAPADDMLDQDEYQDVGGFRLKVPTGGPVKAPMPSVTTGTPQNQTTPGGGDSTGYGLNVNPGTRMVRPGGPMPQSTPDMPAPDVSAQSSSAPIDAINAIKSRQMPPAPPVMGAPGSTMGELIRKRADLGTPTDPRDPQYRMGTGQRILQTVGNALRGFGTRGNTEPVYVGPGATNNKFDVAENMRKANLGNVDTQIGQQEKLGEENRKMYDSGVKSAYESTLGEARNQTAQANQARADAQQQTADTKQQLADQKNSDREITYDPKTKRFMRDGKTYIPKTVEEGASLEAGSGVEGTYSKLWSKEKKNQAPAGPRKTADEIWEDKFQSEHGRPSTSEEFQNRKVTDKPAAQTFKDKASVDKYSDNWYRQERSKVDQQKRQFELENKDADPDEVQAGYKKIEQDYQQRAADFENRKKDYYAGVGGKKGQSSPSATPIAQPAGEYKHKAVNPQTGQKIGSNDGSTWYDRATGKPI